MLLAAARRPVLNFQRTAGVDFDMCCNAFQFNYYSIYITNILGRFRSSASFAPVHPADPAVGATPSTLREGATPSCTCCLWSLVLLFPYLDSQIEIIIKISRFMKHVWNVKFLIQTHWNVIVSIYIYIYIVHMDPIGINIYVCVESWTYCTMNWHLFHARCCITQPSSVDLGSESIRSSAGRHGSVKTRDTNCREGRFLAVSFPEIC